MGVPSICHIKCMLCAYAVIRNDRFPGWMVESNSYNVWNIGSRRLFSLFRIFLRQAKSTDGKLLEEQDSKTDHTVDSIGDTGKNVVLTYQ